MSKKRLVATIGILLGGLIVGFVVGWFVKPAPTPEPVLLKTACVWTWLEEEAINDVLTEFTSKTAIETEYKAVPEEWIDVTLPMMLNLKEAAADVSWIESALIRHLAGEGHLMDLTDLIDESNYPPAIIDQVKVDGKIYGVPFKSGGTFFYYRKSFFQEYNLTPPTTYEEFKALLAKIKEIPGIVAPMVSGDGWPLRMDVEGFITGLGGPELYLELISGKTAWTDSKVRKVFNELAQMIKSGYFGVPGDPIGLVGEWWEGNYGFYFMGSWLSLYVPDVTDLGFFAFPGSEGDVLHCDYAFVPVYSKHSKEDKELIKFLASAEGQSVWAKRGGMFPLNLKVPRDIMPEIEKKVAETIDGLVLLPELDGGIGGDFTVVMDDQLKLFWVKPDTLDGVLKALEAAMPE
jgi:multiple sugar transport system substrate-binding protein